jgi:DNA-binding transcriptional LysR family regulator
VDIRPVLMTQDFGVLMAAAKAGQGIALLPETVCADAVRAGELKLVFRDWQLSQGICHAVYPRAAACCRPCAPGSTSCRCASRP